MDPFVKACIRANEEISKAIESGFDVSWYEKTKVGAGGDVSSGLDLFAESVFVKHLSSFGAIESEESGIIGEGDAHIIIDPIDGSSNALSAFPYYGTSVARVNAEGVLDAAIVCNLANGDVFIKTPSEVLMKGKLFSVLFKPISPVPNAEVGLFEKAYANANLISLLDEAGLKFRSPGAIALSLAYAHTAMFVLFIGRFRIYDFAAGLALCEGLEVIVEQDYVIVSKNKTIVEKIETILKAARTLEEGCHGV
ncbi:Inositol-1-monophosphatase [hydrothermal vent metagenome]|uniref:Inositol-1-monophosphatase n=1 Tax=hydrothermal vent metagenome TaxID=652676 RepID=A0A1W1EA65_9ZZZZ